MRPSSRCCRSEFGLSARHQVSRHYSVGIGVGPSTVQSIKSRGRQVPIMQVHAVVFLLSSSRLFCGRLVSDASHQGTMRIVTDNFSKIAQRGLKHSLPMLQILRYQ